MKKLYFLVLLAVVFTTAGHAQSIRGKLADLVDNTPLAGATVELYKVKDSTDKQSVLGDAKGEFRFAGLSVDSFLLKISYVNYDPYRQFVVLTDSVTDINLGTLFIPKKTKDLDAVVVTSKTPPAQQIGDTTQYNASQFKVNPDATTEDLIKKMPGITVDRDGTVTAQGEQVKKVTIDGREFFGDDATTALKNLPAQIVDKIQVFDKLSDQAQFTGFDDGNSQKAINIVTKSGLKNGQFGRVYAGYGTDSRYSAGGNMSFFSKNRRISLVGLFNNINQQNFGSQDLLGVSSSGGGFRGGGGRGGGRGGGTDNFMVGQQSGISKTNAAGVNYSDKWGKKVDVQASYFFNQSNNVNDQDLKSQTLLSSGKKQYLDQTSYSKTKNYNHRFNMRMEYKIDQSNSLIINPSLNFQKNNSYSNSIAQTYYGINDTSNTSNSNTSNYRDGYNLRNNILYRHSFAKRGRTLSVNLNTVFNKNDSRNYSYSQYRFFYTGFTEDSLLNQYSDNATNGYTLSGNIAYTEPVGKKGQIQINYNPSFSKNNADQQTFLYDPSSDKYSHFDTTLSNLFDNTITTNNGGISYRIGSGWDNQFSIGVNLQHSRLESDRTFPTVTSVDQSFTNLLPNLRWSKKLSSLSRVNVFYRASTNFPSVSQLQDVVNLSNPLRVSSGNPALKQSYSHFLVGRYSFINTKKGQSLFVNMFLQAAQDYISNATYIASADSAIQQNVVLISGSQLTKPVNLDGYKSLRSFVNYGVPVNFMKSNINLNAGFTYSRLPGLINNVETKTDNYVYNAGIVIASNISEYIDFNLSYSANFNNTKSSLSTQEDNKYVNQVAGFQVNLLSKNGWFIQNDVSNQTYSGLSDGFNQNFWLWNAAVGKKFLKNKVGELKLSVFDLLKQNQSIVRTVSENYIQDVQSRVLRQYFMLTFTYSLKNFGTGKAPSNEGRRMGPPPGGGFGGPPPF